MLVEPDLPRSLTYAIMRPWRPVNDTIVYNEGLLMDALAQSLINRRLEARARGGGSYLVCPGAAGRCQPIDRRDFRQLGAAGR